MIRIRRRLAQFSFTMPAARPVTWRFGRKTVLSAIFARKRHRAVRCSAFSLRGNGDFRNFLALSQSERALLTSKPNAEQTPTGHDGYGNVTNGAQIKTKGLQAAIRHAELVAAPIAKGIDETLRFVFVFAAQNGE